MPDPLPGMPTPRREGALRLARVGALLGLFEGLALARWDVWMDDLRPARLAEGGAWALATVGLEAAVWAILGALTRGNLPVSALLWLLATGGARWAVGDRFEWSSLIVAPIALILAWPRRPQLAGALAVLLAIPALWGRVPNYTVSDWDRVVYLAPFAALVVVLGAVRSRRALGALAAAGLALGLVRAAAPGPASAEGPPKRNVLFILVDTLRQDHVGPWANKPLEQMSARLASEGVTFEDAITVIPKTTQSVAAMQTGRYPARNGVRVLKDRLSGKSRTLAELLREQGYQTGAFVHNGWIMRGRGFEQGFAQFWSWFEIERPWGPLRYSGAVTALDAATTRRIQPFDGDVDAAVVTDRALDWLEQIDGPFYAYVHYFDPHWPYRPPGVDSSGMVNEIGKTGFSRGKMMFQNPLPEAENDKARHLYALEIDHTEQQIERLLAWLDASGHRDDTLVVFTADHGHHLGDHSYWYHHGEFLYEPGVQIPLIMRLPGAIEPGSKVSAQVRSIDILPTVLGLLGLPLPDKLDGADALAVTPPQSALLETDISYFKENTRRYVPGVKGKVRGLRTDRYKLILTPREGAPLWELYDHQADPAESNDLIANGTAPPEVLADLMAQFAAALPDKDRKALEALGTSFTSLPTASAASTAAPAAAEDAEMSASDMQMLRSLGYVE